MTEMNSRTFIHRSVLPVHCSCDRAMSRPMPRALLRNQRRKHVGIENARLPKRAAMRGRQACRDRSSSRSERVRGAAACAQGRPRRTHALHARTRNQRRRRWCRPPSPPATSGGCTNRIRVFACWRNPSLKISPAGIYFSHHGPRARPPHPLCLSAQVRHDPARSSC